MFQKLVFRFFVLQRLLLKSDYNQPKVISFAHDLVEPRKKSSLTRARFLTNRYILTHIYIFERKFLNFLVLQRLVFQI